LSFEVVLGDDERPPRGEVGKELWRKKLWRKELGTWTAADQTSNMEAMASRMASIRALLPDFESALHSFTSSPAKFRVVRTVNATKTQPRTLYILDSSFNPPSIAHLTLATSALKQHAPSEAAPCRLLLLFSTHNADKAPSPASFVQRIALMTVFAQDLSQHLKRQQSLLDEEILNVSIDIGLTKEPYYSDKSAAIKETRPPFYSSDPIHVHLVGYDTLIRFCNPKYYPKHDPPLSALKPFFDAGHKLRVTQRPADASDESSNEFGTVEEQKKYLQGLRDGKEENKGFVPAWGNSIDMAQAEKGVGVSSTRVRNAAKDGKWDVVSQLCTEGVAAWLKDQMLYNEDASGKKMMG
jgi:nicotinamide-nucleotide adenylyltransferase